MGQAIDYKQLSDADLVFRLKEGDHAAYSEIYQRFFGLLYAFIYKRLRDKDETKDILQELFTDVWLKRETLQIPVLSSYLYKAVRNKMINLMVHKDVEEKYMQSIKNFMEHDTVMTDHLVREKELAAIIEKEVDLLPNRIREVFLRSRQANMTYKEISDELHLTKQSVRTYIKSAIKILRLKLGLIASLSAVFYFFN
ncbi:RNA polymerase sigma-70 factor, ECF subfamily [Pedobacter sp. ok626]|uniref:RNA polymerase sigma-70 factor n=1 Tax=Pedobacter sp. ok626 TaxID=1761882 RepID=UPI000882018F|nr:RNA polymerase sigma-70 factor [Pedobacter sp. ok626]SDK10832.1 RNA polymerase sigma-70 factor, ECF subfamily [Pedobacter sp. ok626]